MPEQLHDSTYRLEPSGCLMSRTHARRRCSLKSVQLPACALGQGLRDAGDRLRLQGRREERQQRDDRPDGALVHDRVDVLLCEQDSQSIKQCTCKAYPT